MVGADDGGIDDQVLEVRIVRHRREDAPSHALAAAAAEARRKTLFRSPEDLMVAPWRTGAHDPQHRLHEHAVVATRPTRALVAEDRTVQNPMTAAKRQP